MKNRKSMIAAVLAMTVVAGAFAFSPIDARAAETFDPVFYAETYADVAAVFGTDANALYNHYANYGRYEGRKAYAGAVGGEEVSSAVNGVMQVTVLPEFDPVFYAETYPDVAAGYICPDDERLYYDYINYGRYEGRKPYAGAVGGEAVLRSGVSNRIVKITDISNTELSQYNTHEWYDLGDSFVYIAEDGLDQPYWEDELAYVSVLDERYPDRNARSGGGVSLIDGRFVYFTVVDGCPNLNNFADKYGY